MRRWKEAAEWHSFIHRTDIVRSIREENLASGAQECDALLIRLLATIIAFVDGGL